MQRLEGAVRTYAWGSRTALAEFRGAPVPSNHPEAELWLGAHPSEPSRLIGATGDASLLDVLRADPDGQLGAGVVSGFGARLPFLLKVLAAAEPLSLQAHPSLAQAKEGYARENAAGIALDAPSRNYRDDNHKPELVVALGPFEALAGFRDPRRTVALFEAVGVPGQYVDMLARQPDSSGLRALFTTWITLPAGALREVVDTVVAGCARYLHRDRTEFAPEAATIVELAQHYPGDPGVLGALLLNRVSLAPGEGLYLNAGNLHAYLGGLAVEIMANSDNVLRGGLTPKHVDVPELLRVLDFEPVDLPVLRPHRSADGLCVYRTPTTEFALLCLDLDAVPRALDVSGPHVVLCTAGSVTLRCGADELRLDRGAAAWVPASDPELTVAAENGAAAQVYIGAVGSLV